MTSRLSASRKCLGNTSVDHKRTVHHNNTETTLHAALCKFIQSQRKGLHKAFCGTYFICLRLYEKLVLSLILLSEAGYEMNPICSADYSNIFHERSCAAHKHGIHITKATTPLYHRQ
jgi:hypothetical protein